MAALFDFSGAFTTPIGLKIEQATSTDAINWGLNLEICDMVNDAQDGPDQAVKAVRKRFDQRKGMDTTLVLLDTLVKNCGRRLHLHIANRDFMCDLIKLVSPRDATPQHIKDKVLTLIERWTDAFQNDQELAAVGEAYKYLKSQNVQFPAQNLDDMVAIHTPKASHTPVVAPQPVAMSRPPPPTPPQPIPADIPAPGSDLARINKELLVVRGNDTVMNEILADIQSSESPRPDDVQLVRDLNTTCREMHRRLIELLEQVMDEGLVCQLLDLIDKLNNTFLRYDRYERTIVEQPVSNYATPEQPAVDDDLLNLNTDPPAYNDPAYSDPAPANTNPFAPVRLPPAQRGNEEAENIYTTAPAKQPTSSDDVLLAFDPVQDTTVPLSNLAVDDDFDMFAQNRSNTLNERVLASSSAEAYNDAHNVPNLSISGAMAARPHDQQDDWLRDLSESNQAGVSGAMSSEEFDQFLNERAPDPPSHTPSRPKRDDDDLLAL